MSALRARRVRPNPLRGGLTGITRVAWVLERTEERGVHSEYRQEPLGNGRIRFIVTPAAAPRASIGPIVLCGMAVVLASGVLLVHGSLLRPATVSLGAVVGGLLLYVALKRGVAHRVRRFRSPGGAFIASATGIELPTGAAIPRDQLERLTLRNGMPSAQVAVLVLPRRAAGVSYLLCAEHGGQSTTLAGGMTELTAHGLLRDAGEVLRLPRVADYQSSQ